VATICWSVFRVRELPLSAAQRAAMAAQPTTMVGTLREIRDAIVEMPGTMRQLAVMKLFQWYGMVCYWQYVTYAVARSVFHTADPNATPFHDAVLMNGKLGGFYNAVAFVGAFAMVPFTRRFGPRIMHAFCLTCAGLGMLALPSISDRTLLFLPMVGVGLGWASIMGNPYVMLARSIPERRTGVYMGIFNMFIVIPMLLQSLTLPLYYHRLLDGDPRNVVMLAGALLLAAAAATLAIRIAPDEGTASSRPAQA
jgi:maltose/moltooligosaccharide transporter